MAVTVQVQFESVVTQMYQDVFVDSSIENGTTFIEFDLRKLDFQREFGTTSTIYWPKEPYVVEVVPNLDVSQSDYVSIYFGSGLLL